LGALPDDPVEDQSFAPADEIGTGGGWTFGTERLQQLPRQRKRERGGCQRGS
jgi:hypothetical protein